MESPARELESNLEPSDGSNDDDDLNSDDHSNDEQTKEEERTNIRSELQSMSFAELLELKEKLGSKVYNEAMFGADANSTSAMERKKRKRSKLEFKRENKNRPREITAKKQVPLLGKALKSKSSEEKRPRDPRFDSKCGDFDRDKFKEDYSFVNEIREKEAAELKEQLKRMRNDDPEEKKKLKLVLQRMQNQNLEEKKLKERKQAKLMEKQQIKDAIQKDKKPYFISKREHKAQELVKQYLELKNAGKLNKHLEKRRKKNMAKDRKKYSFD